jgi:DNA-binding transcriptional MerR regulator
MDIGEVRARTGLTAATLHHYEQLGLIASVGRVGLRRQYDEHVIERLAVVSMCQRSGFTLREIADLLASRIGGRRAWKARAVTKLAELDERIAQLQLARDGLSHAIECPSPDIMQCRHFRSNLDAVFTAG